MEIRFVALDLPHIDSLRFEAIVLSAFEDERPLQGGAGLCDWRLNGQISRALAGGRVTSAPCEAVLLPVRPRLPFDKLLMFGLGPRAAFSRQAYEEVVQRMFTALVKLRLRTFVVALPGRATADVTPSDAIRWFLAAAGDRNDLDEVVVLDEPDAQRVMAPVVDAERRRLRATREVAEE